MPNMVEIGLGVGRGRYPVCHVIWATLCFFVFFVYLSRRPDETPRPITTLNGSYDAVSAKEVPFGVSMTKNHVWGSKSPKKRNFWERE